MSAAPVGAPSWFDLSSPDPDAAEAFYGKVFGWTFTEDSGPEMGHYRMAVLDGKVAAGLGKMQEGMPRSAWSVYLRTEDADATAEKVVAEGGQLVAPPMDIPQAGRMAIFADPGGAVFGVWQNGAHEGAEVMQQPGAMAWAEVNSPDASVANDFYGAICGVQPKKLEGMDYYTQHLGSAEEPPAFGVLQMNEQWEGVPPHWMPYFAVADTDATCEKVTEAGGKVCVPPFDTPYGRIAVVEDPFGATFSLTGSNPS